MHLLLLFHFCAKWCRPQVAIILPYSTHLFVGVRLTIYGVHCNPLLMESLSHKKTHLFITMTMLLCLYLTWLASLAFVCPAKQTQARSHFHSIATNWVLSSFLFFLSFSCFLVIVEIWCRLPDQVWLVFGSSHKYNQCIFLFQTRCFVLLLLVVCLVLVLFNSKVCAVSYS